MVQGKWKGTTGGGHFGQHAMLVVFSVIDVAIIYPLIFFIIPFYMVINRKECDAIFKYLHKLMGYNVLRASFMTFWNHVLFGMMMLDRFAIYAGKKRRFRVETDGVERFNELLGGDKGFVVAGAHVGNFELCGYVLHQDKKPINALIYGGETAEIQSNRNKIFASNNVRIVPVSADMSHLFTIKAALDKGDIVSASCDRILGSAKSVEVNFLGEKARLPLGAFRLVRQLEVPMIGIFVFKSSFRGYTAYVRSLDYDNLPQSYADTLGDLLKKHPCQWFNYYDFWAKD